MSVKYGVFIGRMQPVHNAHLALISKALEENDKVLIVLGSSNKEGTYRNPYSVEMREQMLRECFNEEQNEKITIATLPDWSTEDDEKEVKTWGRYFYYNVVSRIGQKRFSLYYSDELSILDSWFDNTEVKQYITYRHFDRDEVFDGLSATKIRQALLRNDKDYVKKYCPVSVMDRFDGLASLYEDAVNYPVDDFSME